MHRLFLFAVLLVGVSISFFAVEMKLMAQPGPMPNAEEIREAVEDHREDLAEDLEEQAEKRSEPEEEREVGVMIQFYLDYRQFREMMGYNKLDRGGIQGGQLACNSEVISMAIEKIGVERLRSGIKTHTEALTQVKDERRLASIKSLARCVEESAKKSSQSPSQTAPRRNQ
jgi:hypothetical protein